MHSNFDTIDDFAKLIYGGNSPADDNQSIETSVVEEVYDTATSDKVQVFKPHITRPNISKFEFVRVCTAAAKYLYSIPDLSKYINATEINSIINPAELAFILITNGKLNATIDRLGYEKVTFSELNINPVWINMIKNYFNYRHEMEKQELLIPYGLCDK